MQKHVPSPQTYIPTNYPSVFPMLFKSQNYVDVGLSLSAVTWIYEITPVPGETKVNSCQWKQFILQLNHIFWVNPSFYLVETSFLSFGNSTVLFWLFCASGNYYWNLGEVNFKWRPVFSIYSEFLRFFKVEANFLYNGNAFSNKSFILASGNRF